jgi:hypothetical protein
MTLKELSQLYHLNREIEMDQRRLEELRTKAESPSSGQLTGMPKNPTVESKLERYVAELVDLEMIIHAKQLRCIHEQKRLERYIGDIDDSLTRQVFYLRCVNGLNWVQVAVHIGGGNTDTGVKQRFYRYVRENNGSD